MTSLLMIAWASLGAEEAHRWQWPINTAFGASASFSEYRGARFHMGVDFSTGGVEGEPVRPARDGVIFKARAERQGYGLSAYVRHPDGQITVYAHLAAFGPKLTQAIREAGYDPSARFGQIELSVRVLKDEILAYSGESGAGLPHLHFEVRDGTNRPIDPMTLDFPPLPENNGKAVITALKLLPLDPSSQVNGGFFPFIAEQSGGRIQAKGRIGVQALAHILGPRDNRLGCRGVRVTFGGQIVGEWLPRAIAFDQYRNAALVYDQAVSGFGPTQFAYCFDQRASQLPETAGFRQTRPIDVVEPAPLVIEVMNLTGQWNRYEWTLDPNAGLHSPALPPWTRLPVQTSTLSIHAHNRRLQFEAFAPGSLQTPDALRGLAVGERVFLTVSPSHAPFELTWRVADGKQARLIGALPRKESFTFAIGDWRITGKNVRLHESLAVVVEPANPAIEPDALAFESPVIWFGRHGLPAAGLRAGYRFDGLNSPERVGLYAWSFNKQSWRYWGGPEKEGFFGSTLDYLTPLVVARDVSPPKILKPKIHEYFTGKRVVIPITDKGSGVDPDAVIITGPNGPLRTFYDRDRKWAILPTDAPGPWTATAKDRSGLSARVSGLKL